MNTNTNTNARHSAMQMDVLLENEKIKNKTESWNKLEKTDKMDKLQHFAQEWNKKHNLNTNTNTLYLFLVHCLEKNKLKNKKDIIYNKETMEIKSIPSLLYENNTFKLVTDTKRISTLKCLTPKREIG
jgi:flagellin-specific chaperone FliS